MIKKLAFAVVLISASTPVWAQQLSTADYNAAIMEIASQRELMSQRAINASVQISQLQKQIEELKAKLPKEDDKK